MILVDIYIPAVDDTYDFLLDEDTEAGKLVLEICEMVSKKIQGGPVKNTAEFMLYHMDKNKVVEKMYTLRMAGVRDGSRLMLI